MEGVRLCTRCGEERQFPDEFHRDKHQADGYTKACKFCRSKKAGAWNKANPERAAANQKTWRDRHPEEVARRKRSTQVESYGISMADYEANLGSSCPICERDLVDPVIDHDHDTGQVRGVICRRCNTGIGMLSDDPVRLIRAATYLVNPPFKGY